jgi:hypothetical protein
VRQNIAPATNPSGKRISYAYPSIGASDHHRRKGVKVFYFMVDSSTILEGFAMCEQTIAAFVWMLGVCRRTEQLHRNEPSADVITAPQMRLTSSANHSTKLCRMSLHP